MPDLVFESAVTKTYTPVAGAAIDIGDESSTVRQDLLGPAFYLIKGIH